jgi:hypothetical protein
MPFNVLDVVKLGGKRILDIDDDDLPVGLAFIEKGHDTQDLYLLNLTTISYLLTDLADVEGVIVTLCFRFSMGLGRIFPGLYNRYLSISSFSQHMLALRT